MTTTTGGGYLYAVLTGRGVPPLDHPDCPVGFGEVAALTSVLCSELVAVRFATPDDVRIGPFAAGVAARVQGLDDGVVVSLVRGTLGDHDQLAAVPPEQVAALQLLVVGTVLVERRASRAELDDLISRAEPVARAVLENPPPNQEVLS